MTPTRHRASRIMKALGQQVASPEHGELAKLASQASVDVGAPIDDGKCILINTHEGLGESRWCPFLGQGRITRRHAPRHLGILAHIAVLDDIMSDTDTHGSNSLDNQAHIPRIVDSQMKEIAVEKVIAETMSGEDAVDCRVHGCLGKWW